MGSERLVRLARWGAALLCASTTLVVVLDTDNAQGISRAIGRPLLAVLSLAYCALLFGLLRPEASGARAKWLGGLMVLSVWLDFDNLAALNLFALSFVTPRRPGAATVVVGAGRDRQRAFRVRWTKLNDANQRLQLAACCGPSRCFC